ncbi:MAG TPA: hypothetical protein VEW06_06295 [Xanthobacteraceae bacterium]|nr:hypothetical protein [Xanthobacteraceae bacterium]
MLNADQLLLLARAYSQATGLSLYGIGKRACGPSNDKAFLRLQRGQGINARTLEQAATWLVNNWPQNALWPISVPGQPIATVPKFTAGRARPKVPNPGNTPGGSRSASA